MKLVERTSPPSPVTTLTANWRLSARLIPLFATMNGSESSTMRPLAVRILDQQSAARLDEINDRRRAKLLTVESCQT